MNKKLKSAALILLALFITAAAVSCGNKKAATVDVKTYTYEASKLEHIKPNIVLNDDKTYIFTFAAESSFLSTGNYEIEDDMLRLTDISGEYVYCFNIKDDTLIFNVKASSTEYWGADLTANCVFK